MVYADSPKTIWGRLGPIRFPRAEPSGSRLTSLPIARPLAEWRPPTFLVLNACSLSLPEDTCWLRANSRGASSPGSLVGVRPSLPAWIPPCAEMCVSPVVEEIASRTRSGRCSATGSSSCRRPKETTVNLDEYSLRLLDSARHAMRRCGGHANVMPGDRP